MEPKQWVGIRASEDTGTAVLFDQFRMGLQVDLERRSGCARQVMIGTCLSPRESLPHARVRMRPSPETKTRLPNML